MINNKAVLKKALEKRKKQTMERLVKRSNENWKNRLAKYFTGNVVINSNVSSDGSKGYSEIKYPWIGVQNRGYTVPDRRPVRASALVFRVGGRGTLVRNSLDSVRPIEGQQLVFTQFASGFEVMAGNWDRANKIDLLETL